MEGMMGIDVFFLESHVIAKETIVSLKWREEVNVTMSEIALAHVEHDMQNINGFRNDHNDKLSTIFELMKDYVEGVTA